MKKRKKILHRLFLQMMLTVSLCERLVLSGCSGKETEILIQDFQAQTSQADGKDASDTEEEAAEPEHMDAKENSDTGKRKDPGDNTENNTDIADDRSENTEGNDTQKSGKEPEDPTQTEDGVSEKQLQAVMIYVDVCGAVANPGVFALEKGSRIFQAIEAAGGYLPQAAQACVNRAQILTDGQQIYILTQEEMEQQGMRPGETQTTSVTADDFSAGSAAERQDGRININTADENQLTALTGIGSTRAQAIIAYRESNGPFLSIEDIMNVQGIKEGTFAKIKDEIVVE